MKEDEEHDLLAVQASEWLVRLETATPEEQQQFSDWIGRSPLHVKEVLEAFFTKELIKRNYRDALAREALAKSCMMELIEPPNQQPLQSAPRSVRAARFQRALFALAAVLLLAVPGVLFHSYYLDHTIQTDVGAWATKVLEDGSTVFVGPDTRLTIDFDARQRLVELVRGEALFKVAKDLDRPFIVRARDARVMAVGTSFEVAQREGELSVAVKEGVVSVASEARDLTLRAGEAVMVSAAGVHAIDARVSFDLARRRIDFKNATVSQAVLEFNRRNRPQIMLMDSAVGSKVISGSFNISDPEALVSFIERRSGVTAVGEGEVVRIVRVPSAAEEQP